MLIDHAGLSLLPGVPALRMIGRVSFVLYCFLLVEGYVHTRSRRAYLRRLLVCAVISEVPYDLFLFAKPFCGLEQNVLFTLSLSLCALAVVDRYRNKAPAATALTLCLCLTAMLAQVSYAWLGILLCLCFYVYRDQPGRRAAGVLALEGLYALSLLLSGESFSWAMTNLLAVAALLPIALYNHQSGPRAFKTLFYIAYPLSLLAMYAIRTLRMIPPYWGFFG